MKNTNKMKLFLSCLTCKWMDFSLISSIYKKRFLVWSNIFFCNEHLKKVKKAACYMLNYSKQFF